MLSTIIGWENSGNDRVSCYQGVQDYVITFKCKGKSQIQRRVFLQVLSVLVPS